MTWVDIQAYASGYAIFPFVTILIVAKGVFSDSLLQFKSGWWFTFFEFVIISFGVWYILQSDYIQNIFL